MLQRKFFFLFIISLQFIYLANFSMASTGETYGYGSRSAAMGNTMFGGTNSGFATFYNPAANSAHSGIRITFAVGFAHPSFTDIKGVTIANNATTAQPGDVVGDVDTDSYLDHLAQTVGMSLNLGERFRYFTLGVAASMPLARVGYLDSGEPFKPEYFQYRSRTQRPQIYASASLTPIDHLHVGAGLSIATNLSGAFTAFATGAQNSVSYQRIATTIKPSASPYFGMYVDPGNLEAGVTVRLANRSKLDIDTTANARLLGPTNDLPLVINSTSSIFYDPLEIDLAASYRFFPEFLVTGELDWYNYKMYEPPTIKVKDLGSVSRLQNSIDNSPTLQNIFVPKIGIEYSFPSITVRGGYWYRPSPVTDNSGSGNLVDPTKHVLSAGVGVDLKKIQVTEKEIELDLHAQFHKFIQKHIDKSAKNEVGVSGQTKIGSPGYDIGGHIYSAGIAVTMRF